MWTLYEIQMSEPINKISGTRPLSFLQAWSMLYLCLCSGISAQRHYGSQSRRNLLACPWQQKFADPATAQCRESRLLTYKMFKRIKNITKTCRISVVPKFMWRGAPGRSELKGAMGCVKFWGETPAPLDIWWQCESHSCEAVHRFNITALHAFWWHHVFVKLRFW